jgi:nucleoid-associated protein YgaU
MSAKAQKEVKDGKEPRPQGADEKPSGKDAKPKQDNPNDGGDEGESKGGVRSANGGKRKGEADAAGRRDRLTGAMTFPSVYDKLDKRKEDSSIRGRSLTKEK